MPRWSIFTEERRKDTIKRAQMQKKSKIIFALPSASIFSKGDDKNDLRVKNADNAVLQSGK